MSTVDALQWLWDGIWGWGIVLWPALFVAACAVPEYMSYVQTKRMWFLKRLIGWSLLLIIVPCIFSTLSIQPFWDAMLGRRPKVLGMLIFGMIGLCVSGVFALAELAVRERSRKREGIQHEI